MSDIIRLLPDSVANQIAAGEVIQRPASVVKELVENAVDARATRIEVIIRDAGRTLIQVVDDGKGMSETDARMAFERHATSKISKADDLYSLSTMGFRGEALASICAVAQVELRTRTADNDLGTRLEINGSKVEAQESIACAKGANMMVKNLFFNIPARRRFLKKDTVEFTNIAREFERMALVNPSVDMTLVHNDSTIHQLIRGSFKQRISDLFGKSIERQLIPVQTATSLVTIDGFVGVAEQARRRNALQYLTVNGRHMRHPYFHKAIMHCYETLIAPDQQPNYFLNFTVDPRTIDVNIHPTKNEIKFENEAAIWQILVAAVREALGRFNVMPGIDFDTADAIDLPAFNPNANGSHGVEIDPDYNPFAETAGQSAPSTGFSSPRSPGQRKTAVAGDWQKLYDGFFNPSAPQAVGLPSADVEALFSDEGEGESTDATSSIQVRNRFIMSPSRSGLMIIDQHRAHVKVLFELYRSKLEMGEIRVQQVMFPEVLRLSPQQSRVLREIEPSVREMGFDLSFLADDSWSIVGVPSMVGEINPTEMLMKIIEDASADIEASASVVIDRIALAMARSAAIRRGVAMTDIEREKLIGELLHLPSPNYTPDGLPVVKVLSEADLDSLFSRGHSIDNFDFDR